MSSNSFPHQKKTTEQAQSWNRKFLIVIMEERTEYWKISNYLIKTCIVYGKLLMLNYSIINNTSDVDI